LLIPLSTPDAGSVPGDIVAISGYLQKKTRDGRWQKRWFETNGCFLTYYKVRQQLQDGAVDQLCCFCIDLLAEPQDSESDRSIAIVSSRRRGGPYLINPRP